MGLMEQFNRSSQQHTDRLSEALGLAQSIVGNDPRAALKRMADSGVTCNLPDGRVVPVSTLVGMAEGKTPQQLLAELGIK